MIAKPYVSSRQISTDFLVGNMIFSISGTNVAATRCLYTFCGRAVYPTRNCQYEISTHDEELSFQEWIESMKFENDETLLQFLDRNIYRQEQEAANERGIHDDQRAQCGNEVVPKPKPGMALSLQPPSKSIPEETEGPAVAQAQKDSNYFESWLESIGRRSYVVTFLLGELRFF